MKDRRIWICILITLFGVLLTVGVVAAAQLQLQAEATTLAGTKVGLIPDEAGVTPGNIFNWLSYQGLLRAETELGVVGTVYTPTDTADYGTQLQQCVDDGNDLCISVGFQFQEVTQQTALNNPGTYFSIVDVEYVTYTENLRGMVFSNAEAGYLAGALAGLMTASDQVGGIGGMEISVVTEFMQGYQNGAQCNNADVEVLVEYAGTFVGPEGPAIAQDMIAQGADVIFAAAGPTGSGAVLTATQSGAWAIGVDTDQYITLFGNGTVDGSDKLLSSAVKNLDNAVFGTISDVDSGSFISGTLEYDLALGGVGLAPFHEADVPQFVSDTLDAVEQGIIGGSINIDYDCRSELYLPFTLYSD
jgi:basic membrane lipoprotein Med (substrate-binding protein (PBP1-ABC) superfamily)